MTDSTVKMAHVEIHKAIHDPKATGVRISGRLYPIKVAANGCRFVMFGDYQFMEQNKNKNSLYAKQAKAGKKITWGIIPNQQWMYLDDQVCEEAEKHHKQRMASIGL